MNLLDMNAVTTYYGTSQALFGVDLHVAKGEVVALLGRNGMGKTTTIKSICRMVNHRDGTICFDGQDLKGLPSYRVARLGIGLVPEGRRCFPNLSVEENMLAVERPGEWDIAKIRKLFPRLGERHNQLAATLSGGEQQMLAIGRALVTNPRLLLLDEATEGLAPVVRHEIWDAIAGLKHAAGMAIIIVDKSLKELAKIADRAVILERGRAVWDNSFEMLDPETTNKYLKV